MDSMRRLCRILPDIRLFSMAQRQGRRSEASLPLRVNSRLFFRNLDSAVAGLQRLLVVLGQLVHNSVGELAAVRQEA